MLSGFKQFASAGLAIMICIIFAVLGAGSGKTKAHSKIAALQGTEVANALVYFYSDYDRFPSLQELNSSDKMSEYFTRLPYFQEPLGKCTEMFKYEPGDLENSKFFLCLNKGVLDFKQGWNEIEIKR